METQIADIADTENESFFHDNLQIPSHEEAFRMIESEPTLSILSLLSVFVNKYNSDLDGKITKYMINTMMCKELNNKIRTRAAIYLISLLKQIKKVPNDFNAHHLLQICNTLLEENDEYVKKKLYNSLSTIILYVQFENLGEGEELFSLLLNMVVESEQKSYEFLLFPVLNCFGSLVESYIDEISEIIIRRFSSNLLDYLTDSFRCVIYLGMKNICIENIDFMTVVSNWDQNQLRNSFSFRICVSLFDFYPIIVDINEIKQLFSDLPNYSSDAITAMHIIVRKPSEFSASDIFEILDNILMSLDDMPFSKADDLLTEISDLNFHFLLERPQVLDYIAQHIFDSNGNLHMYSGYSICFIEALKANKVDIYTSMFHAIEEHIDALEEAASNSPSELAASILLTAFNSTSQMEII